MKPVLVYVRSAFRRPILAASLVLMACITTQAHDFGVSITWNKEMSRLVYDKCASCHRDGGTSFSLMTYTDAQPHATAIKNAVLSRRMPPWGAVKGFGEFRNDRGLTMEQIELVAAWVEGGTRRGNNARMLPEVPKTFEGMSSADVPRGSLIATRNLTLEREVTIDGLLPLGTSPRASMPITAALPDGSIVPLVWLYEYSDKYRHPFLFRKPITLPAGTVIRGIKPPARVALIPVTE